MRSPTRRRFVIGLAVAAAAAATSKWWWRRHPVPAASSSAPPTPTPSATSSVPPTSSALRLPGREGLFAELSLSTPLTLRATRAAFPIFAAATELWHYAGEVDGRTVANPLLHVRQGDTLEVALHNALDEDTTIHWHGLSVDEANDGGGLHPVAPGQEARYRFRVDNRAGLYWYHAHPHNRTGAQLQRGLASLLLIDDAEERALRERLNLPWGERDLPLLIADKQVDANGAIVYQDGADDWIGNRVLVNFTPEPSHAVVAGRYRLRLANASNARLMRLAFLHQNTPLPFTLLGTDGGLLAKPWTVEDAFLAPAQRLDVLVDFAGLPSGACVRLRSLAYDPMENEIEPEGVTHDPMADHPGAAPMGAAFDLMEFCVGERVAEHVAPLPETLSALGPTPETQGWPVRPFHLHMDADGTWLINEWNFHRTGHAPVFTVQRGTREVWEIRNAMTSMPHPIHLHGFQFRVLSRSVSPLDVRAREVAPNGLGPQDLGLNDTVLVWPGETVRLALDFSQPFTGIQRYMLHCHNLEHEDMGMMVSFAVADEVASHAS